MGMCKIILILGFGSFLVNFSYAGRVQTFDSTRGREISPNNIETILKGPEGAESWPVFVSWSRLFYLMTYKILISG